MNIQMTGIQEGALQTTSTSVCACVCQGINSIHAQTARFNDPTSCHYCKP